MSLKNICSQLNIVSNCKKYKVSLWQCPQFLFLIMGLIIIFTSIGIYLIGNRYVEQPQFVALIVLVISAVLFVISSIIIQSFERLSEVSRMKSEFINIVSHQLRTPLTNLKWVLEILMSGELGKVGEKQAEYLNILNENNDRMSQLIDNLLIVSRLENGKISFVKKEISLEELIKKTISDNDPFAKASNIEVKFNVDKNLPMVIGDPFQIRLAVENFLDNAIKYTNQTKNGSPDNKKKTKGKIEILLEKRNNKFYFEVKDNGIGVPKDDQKYIFQKFFRAENALRHQANGSGLGLFIVKSIIKSAGGEIGFKSQKNNGSTFWFTLPVKS